MFEPIQNAEYEIIPGVKVVCVEGDCDSCIFTECNICERIKCGRWERKDSKSIALEEI